MKNLRNVVTALVLMVVVSLSVVQTRAGLLVSDFTGSNGDENVCKADTTKVDNGIIVVGVVGVVVTGLTGVVVTGFTGVVVTDSVAKETDCAIIVHD